MPVLLVRPYPVHRLAEAKRAIDAASRGDVAPLQALYRAAADALAELDPDEVEDFREEHRRAGKNDQALALAAVTLADTWEGIVSIGSMIRNPARFRGFAWLAAQVRYEAEPAPRTASQLRAYADGAPLPYTELGDAALYAALPALIGLGPELPDEIIGTCPFTGDVVGRLLGLPEADWEGIDPLDATAITAETCRAHFAAAPVEWRGVLTRAADRGMVVRVSVAQVQ